MMPDVQVFAIVLVAVCVALLIVLVALFDGDNH
jgi:hypothetical protein